MDRSSCLRRPCSVLTSGPSHRTAEPFTSASFSYRHLPKAMFLLEAFPESVSTIVWLGNASMSDLYGLLRSEGTYRPHLLQSLCCVCDHRSRTAALLVDFVPAPAPAPACAWPPAGPAATIVHYHPGRRRGVMRSCYYPPPLPWDILPLPEEKQ